MRRRGPLLAGAMLLFALSVGQLSVPATAGGVPEIASILEGREPGTNQPVLVVNGKGMKSVRGARLLTPGGDPAGTLGVVSPGSTTVSLALPPELEPGPYALILSYGKKKAPVEAVPFPVSIAGDGVLPESVQDEAMHPDLLEDLDDAETMAGEALDYYQDADHFVEGTLPTSLYSAMDDLVDEGHVVDGEFTTDLFSAWADLEDEGIVSGGSLDTSRYSALKDLAAEGILDGSGDLHSDHFSAWADLVDEGYVTTGTFPSSLFSAWASLDAFGQVNADDVLRSDLFDAYADLLAESRIGTTSTQVAAGNHDHDSLYLKTAGASTFSQTLDINFRSRATAPSQPALTVRSSISGTAAIRSDNDEPGESYLTRVEGDPDSIALL
ncbi:MAG: hypothetical protein ACYTG4_06795, partial [Planctomycetota bacterium]